MWVIQPALWHSQQLYLSALSCLGNNASLPGHRVGLSRFSRRLDLLCPRPSCSNCSPWCRIVKWNRGSNTLLTESLAHELRMYRSDLGGKQCLSKGLTSLYVCLPMTQASGWHIPLRMLMRPPASQVPSLSRRRRALRVYQRGIVPFAVLPD